MEKLDDVVDEWTKVFSYSFIRVENRLRKKEGLDPLSQRTRITVKEPIRLLNLRVWTLRYHVPLEFILNALWPRYRAIRKPLVQNPLLRKRTEGFYFSLTPQLTGEASRGLLERAVLQAYPGGENYKAYLQKLRDKGLQTTLAPIANPEYDSPREMIQIYRETMERRGVRSARYIRAWRDNPWK